MPRRSFLVWLKQALIPENTKLLNFLIRTLTAFLGGTTLLVIGLFSPTIIEASFFFTAGLFVILYGFYWMATEFDE